MWGIGQLASPNAVTAEPSRSLNKQPAVCCLTPR
jgi:hypothetical protein